MMNQDQFNLMNLDQLSDEDLATILASGGSDDERRALDEQAAQAQALMQPGQQNYRSVGGAIMGGIGNAIGAYGGAKDMNEVKAARKKLSEDRMKGRDTYAKALLGRRQAAQAQAAGGAVAPGPVPQALAPTSPFSYGGGGPGGYNPYGGGQ